jgi:hypothetical protein
MEKARYVSKYKELSIPILKPYTKEVDGQVVSVDGQVVRFERGFFETDDPKIIKFLDTNSECLQMIESEVFSKINEEAIANAVKGETLEEREARIKKEMDEIKKEKAKQGVTQKEKGKTSKVGKKEDEEPQY